MSDTDTESAIRLQLAMQLGMGKGTSTTEYLASKEMTLMVETIERLTRELGAARKVSMAWREFAVHQSWCANCAESVSSCERGQNLHVAAISATVKNLIERIDHIDEQGYAHMKVPK